MPKKTAVRADENFDVLNEKDYEEDRQVHNPDVREGDAPDRENFEDGKSDAKIDSDPKVEMPDSKPAHDEVLTQPSRYVVDSQDSIEKVEVLLDLIKEARPDLARDVEVLQDGMDQLEQKNVGPDYREHEEEELAAPLPENAEAGEAEGEHEFSAGDPVEVDTDDGTYVGSLIDQNDDGTWEVETDKHVTLSKVPEENLRPVEAPTGMILPAGLKNVNLHIDGLGPREIEQRLRPVFVNGEDLRKLLESKEPEELEQLIEEWKGRFTDVGDQLRDPEFFQNAIREAEEVLETKRSGLDQEVAVAANKKKKGLKAKEQGMKPLSTSSQDHQTAHNPGNPYAGLPKEDKAPTGGKEQQAKELKTSSQEHHTKHNPGDPYADAPKKDEEVAAAAPTDGQAMEEPKHKGQDHFTKHNPGDPYPSMGGDRRSTGSDAAGASGGGESASEKSADVQAMEMCPKCKMKDCTCPAADETCEKCHKEDCVCPDVQAMEDPGDKKMCADCKKPMDVCECKVEASKKTATASLTDAAREDIKVRAKKAKKIKADEVAVEDMTSPDPAKDDSLDSPGSEDNAGTDSAFDKVEELDLGGGWKARRKKGKEKSTEDKPADAAGAPEAPKADGAPDMGDALPGAPVDADEPGGAKSPIPVASVKADGYGNPHDDSNSHDDDDKKDDDKKDDDKDKKDDDKDKKDDDKKEDKKSDSVSKPKDYDGPTIEVVDPDGKVVAEYPDAFGDDTVTIIKMLQQLHDIKEEDAEKKDDDSKDDDNGDKKDEKEDSVADKPKALPTVETKEEDAEALAAAQKIMENRVTAAREVIKEEKEKGYVVADLKDIDDALLAGISSMENGQEVKTPITLEAATDAAVDKAMDRRFKELLAMPDAELLMIKASLPNLPRKAARVEIQASLEGLEPIAAITVHAEDDVNKDFSIGDAFGFKGFGS